MLPTVTDQPNRTMKHLILSLLVALAATLPTTSLAEHPGTAPEKPAAGAEHPGKSEEGEKGEKAEEGAEGKKPATPAKPEHPQ